MTDFPAGTTWFMRCAKCETIYKAVIGFSMITGAGGPYWVRPTPIRAPKRCDHQGDVERWDGTDWVPMPRKETTP